MRGESKATFPTSYFIPHPSSHDLEAMKGVEPLSTGLQDRRSVFQLSYIAIEQLKVPSSKFPSDS